MNRRSMLSRLDDALRWTGIPASVADDLSGDPSVRRRPLRWTPILLIAFACVLLTICLFLPPNVSPAAVVSIMTSMAVSTAGGGWLVHTSGPLGKSASEDDEREAALKKDSFLFCFGVLAVLNGLGQPILLIVSHWHDWSIDHSSIVALSALILNGTLLGTVPTLYASWSSPRLLRE